MAKKTQVQPGEQPTQFATVVKPFRDRDNFNLEYEVGQDVSHFDEDRLSDVVAKGLVEIEKEEQEPAK